MLRLKRLYSFMLQTFLPVFAMTFAITLFIFLMQFIWRYVDDLVGKGLEAHVIGELFFYLALTIVSQSLPLAVLLASLITFGNLGEKFELLAIKAAGVSLFKAMMPLSLFAVFLSVGLFFYQNEVLPKINVKFFSLYRSIAQASPELQIPEGSFYNELGSYSIYVDKKNKETGMLYDVMIYDTTPVSHEDMVVIVCDSAYMSIPRSDYIKFELYSGQQFKNFKEGPMGVGHSTNNKQSSYAKESFSKSTIIIPASTDFTRMDESLYESTQIAKTTAELQFSVDSLSHKIDSVNIVDRDIYYAYIYYGGDEPHQNMPRKPVIKVKGELVGDTTTYKSYSDQINESHALNFDSLMNTIDANQKVSYYMAAMSSVELTKNKYMFDAASKIELQQKRRMHNIEWHNRFSLALSCLIFFMIGAPLGAIIRKGGLGVPVIISVLLFIIYFIIHNVGYKMARDGVWSEWEGVWLSSAVLMPLGIFLTYKATNDSNLFNFEAYGKIFRRLFRIDTQVKYSNQLEIIDLTNIAPIDVLTAEEESLVLNLQNLDELGLKEVARHYEEHGYDKSVQRVAIDLLKQKGAKALDITTRVLNRDMSTYAYEQFVINSKYTLGAWTLTIALICVSLFIGVKGVSQLAVLSLVIYLLAYLRGSVLYSDLCLNINYVEKDKKSRLILKRIFHFLVYPIRYIQVPKVLKSFMDKIDW